MDVQKTGLFALVLLAGAAVGALTNGLLDIGDEVTGSIDSLDQEDTYVFSAVADSQVSILARAYGATKTVKPRIRITDLSTNTLLVDASNTKIVYIKKLSMPTTGQYQITVSGAQDTLGAYKMKTDEKLSWTVMNQKGYSTVPGMGELELPFDAAPGWTLEAKFEAKSKKPYMTAPRLISPSGIDLDLNAFLVNNGPNVKVKNVPLPELGTYQISAQNIGLTGLVRWRITLDDH